jgi:hypothetical protein
LVELPVTIGPVNVSFGEYLRVCVRFYLLKQFPRFFATWGLVFIVGFSVVSYSSQRPLVEALKAGVISGGGGALAGGLIGLLTCIFNVFKQFRVEPSGFNGIHWILKEEGIEIRSGDNVVFPKWRELSKIQNSGSMVYLYLRNWPAQGYYMPVRGFPHALPPDDFVSWGQEKVSAHGSR